MRPPPIKVYIRRGRSMQVFANHQSLWTHLKKNRHNRQRVSLNDGRGQEKRIFSKDLRTSSEDRELENSRLSKTTPKLGRIQQDLRRRGSQVPPIFAKQKKIE